MIQNTFLRGFLLKLSSFLSVVLLIGGLALMYALYFGMETNSLVGLALASAGVVLAAFSLFSTYVTAARAQSELKESTQLAQQLAQGDLSYDAFDADIEDSGELMSALNQVSLYMRETAEIADRIYAGDLSGRIALRGESDQFGLSFKRMTENLSSSFQTQEKRDQLQSSILKLLNEVKGVAAGDLTVKADIAPELTGEIAGAFNFMTTELRSLIGQVKEVASKVGTSAKSINEATEQLAKGSEAQASQISRTTSAISNMALQIQEVSSAASLSAQVADDSFNNARYGTKAVQDNINAMNAIRNQVQETAKRIKKLGERSQEISQTVQLIDDLSDRTSLLALNASLQAAAAGESGRGFAVVAEEVERLAERSNRLTQQIANLAQTIQVETKDVVASMEETIHEVVVGSTLADKAGQALVEIEQVSHNLAQLIQSISESAKEQARSSEDISSAMSNIAKVTDLVNVGSKRAADSGKMLVELSDDLRGSVATFKLPEDKRTPRTSPPQSSEAYLN